MFIINSQIYCVQSSIRAAKGNKPLLLLLRMTTELKFTEPEAKVYIVRISYIVYFVSSVCVMPALIIPLRQCLTLV